MSYAEHNKKLVEKYPFLKDSDDYRTTWLDDLEEGWRVEFGTQLCNELKEAIEKDGCEETFGFDQIKEKYGSLRLYAHGYNYRGNVDNVLCKYEELSKYICGHCGNPATKITKGWIYPVCDKCGSYITGEHSKIEDFYDFKSYGDVLREIEHIKNNYDKGEYWK